MNITHILLSIVSVILFILYWKFRQNIIFPLLLVLIFITVKQMEQNNINYMNAKIENATPIIKEYFSKYNNINTDDINYLINDTDLKLKNLEIINDGSNKLLLLDIQCNKHFVEVKDNFIVQ